MKYRLVLYKQFKKDFKKYGFLRTRIGHFVESLQQDPQRQKSGVKPLIGYQQVFRKRFGDFRLLYKIDNEKKQVVLLRLQLRGSVYKLLEKLA